MFELGTEVWLSLANPVLYPAYQLVDAGVNMDPTNHIVRDVVWPHLHVVMLRVGWPAYMLLCTSETVSLMHGGRRMQSLYQGCFAQAARWGYELCCGCLWALLCSSEPTTKSFPIVHVVICVYYLWRPMQAKQGHPTLTDTMEEDILLTSFHIEDILLLCNNQTST